MTLFQVDQWNEEGVGECSNVRALIDVLNKMRDLELQKSTGNKPVIVHGR